jgi:putative ABC transport system substrate-binding protein
MNRREFITLLGGAAVAWPLAAGAQQPNTARRVGVLMGVTEDDRAGQAYVAAFRGALQKFGWTEGLNVRIDVRWASRTDAESMQRLASEVVALQPDIILSPVTFTTIALLQQTRTIPIVFVILTDPVGSGFVANYAQPGGNVTGFTTNEVSMGSKWLQLLKEIAPGVARIALVWNPNTAPRNESYVGPFKPWLHLCKLSPSQRLFTTCPS